MTSSSTREALVRREVVWSAAAKQDFLEIIRYVAERNPEAALRLADRIDKSVANLADAAIGRAGRVTGTFEKVIRGSPYIVAYEIEHRENRDERVAILHVIHGARDWPDEAWPHD